MRTSVCPRPERANGGAGGAPWRDHKQTPTQLTPTLPRQPPLSPLVGGYALEPALLETGRLWRCVLRVVSLRHSPAQCLSEPQFPHLCKEAGDLLTCRLCPCQVSPECEAGPGGGEGGCVRWDQKAASVPSLSSGKRARTAIDL